jgi:hypothetical protein
MASDGTRLAGLGVFARDTVGLQRGVEAKYELKHCVDEEGRGPRPRVTERRKVGVSQGCCNAAGPLLSIISCPPMARIRGSLLQTSDGSILGRDDDESKAASGGIRRNGKDEVGMVWVCSGVL